MTTQKNRLYELALQLIREGKAYVCHQTGEEISKSREIAKVRLAAFGWCTRSMDIAMDGWMCSYQFLLWYWKMSVGVARCDFCFCVNMDSTNPNQTNPTPKHNTQEKAANPDFPGDPNSPWRDRPAEESLKVRVCWACICVCLRVCICMCLCVYVYMCVCVCHVLGRKDRRASG